MENNTIRPDPEKLQYIIDCLPTEELLAQLAEEAAELAHAALKLRRVEDGTNPTPVPKEDAIKNILEEIADVSLVVNLLGFNTDRNETICREIMAKKTDRWAARLDRCIGNQKSRADRIRQMDDIALAEELYRFCDAPFCRNCEACRELLDQNKEIPLDKCMECTLRYIQEAPDDA